MANVEITKADQKAIIATKVYKYQFNSWVYCFTALYLIVFIEIAVALYFLYNGGYFAAWFCSFAVALIALMTLSIPRKIVVSCDNIKIDSILDVTNIDLKDIISVTAVEKLRAKWFIPLFAGFGFFGYYGHYFDLKNFKRVTIYASEWRNFVEIKDGSNHKYYVSVCARNEFIDDIRLKQSYLRDCVAGL